MTTTAEFDTSSSSPDYNEIERSTEAQILGEAIAVNPELSCTESKYVLLQLDGESPCANVARSLEHRIFSKYFGNSIDEMAQEYAPYESSSKFFLVVDKNQLDPAGVMRLILPSENGLKSVNDVPSSKCQTLLGKPVTAMDSNQIYRSIGIDESRTVDIATLAAAPEHGEKQTGSPVVLASLMRALERYTKSHGYDDLVAIIDSYPMSKLLGAGLPVDNPNGIEMPFTYLGAKNNSFMHLYVHDVNPVTYSNNPDIFSYIFGDMNLLGECTLSFTEQ